MPLPVKKILPFLILFLFVMGCTEEARQQRKERAEAEAREQKAVDARQAVVKELNDKYDIPSEGLCLFRFIISGSNSKTLSAMACRMMGKRKALTTDILTAENIIKLKSVGFEKLDLSQRDGSVETVEIK
jgi:cation diffusion facilitator CzcD-associated flavoprotein CzcO